MLPMYLHELKSHVKSLVIWCAVVFLLVLEAMAEFQAYYNNPEMTKVLKAMPKALLDAFSMRAFNLTTLGGFFGVLSRYYYLLVAAAAALWGSGVVSKEELNKTADFTLVLPLPRRTILTAKALVALTNVTAFVLVTWAISLVFVQKYDPGVEFYRFLALEMAGMFFVGLAFWALGVFLACALRNPRSAGPTGIIVALMLYVLATVQTLEKKLDFLKWVTPFKYFDAADLHRNGALNATYLAIALLVTVALIAVAYAAYNRRDMAL